MSDRIDTEADLTEVEDRDLTRAEILRLYAEFAQLNEAYIMGCLNGLSIDNERRHRYYAVRDKLHDEVELAALAESGDTDGLG